MILTQAGYEIVRALNRKEGQKNDDQKQIELVITAIFLPEKEGIETSPSLCLTKPVVTVH